MEVEVFTSAKGVVKYSGGTIDFLSKFLLASFVSQLLSKSVQSETGAINAVLVWCSLEAPLSSTYKCAATRTLLNLPLQNILFIISFETRHLRIDIWVTSLQSSPHHTTAQSHKRVITSKVCKRVRTKSLWLWKREKKKKSLQTQIY